jgi:hypothetical protein
MAFFRCNPNDDKIEATPASTTTRSVGFIPELSTGPGSARNSMEAMSLRVGCTLSLGTENRAFCLYGMFCTRCRNASSSRNPADKFIAASNLENRITHSENARGGNDSPAKLAARVYKFRIILTRSGSSEFRASNELSCLCALAGVETSEALFDGVCVGVMLPPTG